MAKNNMVYGAVSLKNLSKSVRKGTVTNFSGIDSLYE